MNFTPSQLAKQENIGRSRIMSWIRSGELVAFDIGDGDKPRYRIDLEAWQDFQQRRQVKPVAKPKQPQRIVQRTKKEWF